MCIKLSCSNQSSKKFNKNLLKFYLSNTYRIILFFFNKHCFQKRYRNLEEFKNLNRDVLI